MPILWGSRVSEMAQTDTQSTHKHSNLETESAQSATPSSFGFVTHMLRWLVASFSLAKIMLSLKYRFLLNFTNFLFIIISSSP